jgi:hypothetical protein
MLTAIGEHGVSDDEATLVREEKHQRATEIFYWIAEALQGQPEDPLVDGLRVKLVPGSEFGNVEGAWTEIVDQAALLRPFDADRTTEPLEGIVGGNAIRYVCEGTRSVHGTDIHDAPARPL